MKNMKILVILLAIAFIGCQSNDVKASNVEAQVTSTAQKSPETTNHNDSPKEVVKMYFHSLLYGKSTKVLDYLHSEGLEKLKRLIEQQGMSIEEFLLKQREPMQYITIDVSIVNESIHDENAEVTARFDVRNKEEPSIYDIKEIDVILQKEKGLWKVFEEIRRDVPNNS
ncbi:DUF4878 domain-containing protein [Candidatus Uabimicrobium amorphum]|uniref:Uncharacterized protein n=1 Tax=Uabimicrobium amorphum TaxID=2596890 RepID=A0A5S9IMA8_UABAM|nr:DUF4878 domain-containing protein [Candidatus Uabimicrobium amorphum]BBM84499.1 hypothetical protein UABAM_02860 [Candidatus Uabimicrobium amorphum]